MKRNLRIFIALAVFYIIVALFALILLGGKSSVFNRDRKSYGAKPAALTQTVIGESAEVAEPVATEPSGDVTDVTTTVQEPDPAEPEPEQAEPEPAEPAPEPEPEPEPEVFEIRYFSFRTTNTQPDLRFRTGPSEDASVITKLFPGTGGYITEPGNEWCKVVSNSGREGYLSTRYLAVTELTEETFPADYIDMVEAPTEELTAPQFTTLLKDGSETEPAEGDALTEPSAAEDGTADTETAAQ